MLFFELTWMGDTPFLSILFTEASLNDKIAFIQQEVIPIVKHSEIDIQNRIFDIGFEYAHVSAPQCSLF